MFARHKRRPQNEEPLVPHGLVGQAIEQFPTTLTVVTRNPAAPGTLPSEELSVQTQSELPPVLSLVPPAKQQTAEAALNPATLTLVPPRPESTSPDLSVRSFARSTMQVKPQPLRILMIERVQKHIVEMSNRSRTFLAGNWHLGARFLNDGVASLNEIAKRAQNNVESLELRKQVDHVQRLVVVSAQSIASQAGGWIRKLNAAVVLTARRTNSPTATPSGTSSFSDNQERKFSERYRVRISLEGLPLHARLWLGRVAAKRKLRSVPLSRDSRLWTPLAMGMLAALLVMALFSATGYYAKSALPSNRTSSAGSTAPVSVMPASVTLQPAAIKNTDVRTAPKRLVVHQKTRVAPTLKPRRQHNEDEDYVATDTYVYYGKRSH